MKTWLKPRHLKKCKNHSMRDASVCLSHGFLPPQLLDESVLSKLLLLAHPPAFYLARQSGVQLPTAGIWVCAFNIINNLFFGWMSSQKEGSSTEGLVTPGHRFVWKGLFFGMIRMRCKWLQPCNNPWKLVGKDIYNHQPSTMFTIKLCPQVPHPLRSHCTQLWLFWVKEASES